MAVRRLERGLGVQLFDRTTRRVALTPAGEAFKQRVDGAMAELDDAAGDVVSVAAGMSGGIRVGFVSSASYTAIPEALRSFKEQRPRAELILSPLTSGEQIEKLLDGDLDIGLIRDPGEVPGLAMEPVSTEDLVAVLPEAHPLASCCEVDIDDLAGEPMILFPYRLMPGFVARVPRLFGGLHAAPQVVQQAIHQETVLGLVAAGIGGSILPDSVRRFLICPASSLALSLDDHRLPSMRRAEPAIVSGAWRPGCVEDPPSDDGDQNDVDDVSASLLGVTHRMTGLCLGALELICPPGGGARPVHADRADMTL